MGIWAQLSAQGNAEAEFGLGLLYDLGNGTPENPASAFAWYKLAAQAGVAAAQFNVGAMYDAGRGVARSSERAALWYAQAAARGHHRAQFALGLLYEQGDGVPRNPDAAAAWFQAAVDGGVSAAGARLKALKAASSRSAQGALLRTDQITGVVLAWPVVNASLTLAGDKTVALVWVAPREPKPAHYEVKVQEMSSPTPRLVFQASVIETAALVQLPSNAAHYTWKVETVMPNGFRVASDWRAFSVGLEPRLGQSMTSLPDESR